MKFLMLAIFIVSTSISIVARAQDISDPSQASLDAIKAAEDYSKSLQDAQHARDAADRDQQELMNPPAPEVPTARQPKFSVKQGKVAAGTQVRITCSTPSATIYYVTGGWQATTKSRRYTGPITIRRSTTLEAFAAAPDMENSFFLRAVYTVPGSKPRVPKAVTTNGVLRAGTRLELTTTAKADSKTAKVGDKLLLSLNQNVMAGGKVVIAKGTPVEAEITEAAPGKVASVPGDMTFEVHSLTAQGISIPLAGGEMLRGPYHYGRTVGLALIPAVGVFAAIAAHGSPAAIVPGMTLQVVVASDTPLVAMATAE